jgi:hypothetical protein
LLRLCGDAREQRTRAFARGRLRGPGGSQRVDERAEIAVEALEIRCNRVLRDVSLDGERTRFERE